jgi:acyl carrier protein
MGILSLVTFMETRFGIKASDDDMVPENFETLEALRLFVERKKSA